MKNMLLILMGLIFSSPVMATDLKLGDASPTFKTLTHEGKPFDLNARKGSWTVLYFYPKADTPGCTKQACGFRDAIEKIRLEGADVFGISADSVKDQKAFHEKHKLNFTLLADEKGDVVKLYGAKMFGVSLSKRWTFIIGPDLTIKDIQKDVDPVQDAKRVAQKISDLKKAK